MKKQYFAWKDGKQSQSTQQEWMELTAKEYRGIYENNKACSVNKRRYFVPLPGIETGDVYYCFECDYEQYKKYRAKKEQTARKVKASREDEIRYGPVGVLSLDAEFTDDSGDVYSLHDLIADTSALFEEALVSDIALKSALEYLTDDERFIIDALYFENTDNTSEREIADQMNIPQKTLNNRKLKILKKIKKYLAQN